MGDKIVHVVGTGTIGEPLIGILASLHDRFGIDEVTFHKRSALMSDRPKIQALVRTGAKLCVDRDRWHSFKNLDMDPVFEAEEAIERAQVIIDCTPVGNENKEKFYQRYANNSRGFIAQGSEFGFGKMYARGINDKALIRGIDRFIQVVSCNTHNLAVLIDAITLGPEKENNLEEGLFLCLRRANDISQEGGFVAAPEVERHDDPRFGTHQGRDVHGLFQTLGLDLNLFSSVLRINTQYTHTIFFDMKLRRRITLADVMARIKADRRIALTEKKSSASVFSFGRDHGLFGRILNQTVIATHSLTLKGDHEIVGMCFTPQDGNSLPSSIGSALWYLYPNSYEERMSALDPYFFNEI